ncbi:DedA family protein [Thiolapillus sp.]
MDQQTLVQFLQQLQFGPWAASGVIVLFFLESAPITGPFLPGIFLTVALGSLSGTSYMSFADCVIYASIGALLGDSAGYWVGYLERTASFANKTTRSHKEKHQHIQQLLRRYGSFAVFFGRFIWFAHPLVPVAAGISRVKPSSYYLADIPAVLIWVSIYAGLGHWATGAARKSTVEFIAAVSVLIFAGLLLWYYWHLKRLRQ